MRRQWHCRPAPPIRPCRVNDGIAAATAAAAAVGLSDDAPLDPVDVRFCSRSLARLVSSRRPSNVDLRALVVVELSSLRYFDAWPPLPPPPRRRRVSSSSSIDAQLVKRARKWRRRCRCSSSSFYLASAGRLHARRHRARDLWRAARRLHLAARSLARLPGRPVIGGVGRVLNFPRRSAGRSNESARAAASALLPTDASRARELAIVTHQVAPTHRRADLTVVIDGFRRRRHPKFVCARVEMFIVILKQKFSFAGRSTIGSSLSLSLFDQCQRCRPKVRVRESRLLSQMFI